MITDLILYILATTPLHRQHLGFCAHCMELSLMLHRIYQHWVIDYSKREHDDQVDALLYAIAAARVTGKL
jgi:hypothetical protein